MNLRSTYLGALLALLLAACLAKVEGPESMCEVDTECDYQNGEICDDGVCWGDPPDNTLFAALLVPPEERDDLVRTDLGVLIISSSGDIDDLVFAESVKITGRVVLACVVDADPSDCDPSMSVAAHIRVRRPSEIPGGPTYGADIDALPGRSATEVAFELRLPKLPIGALPYEVTVIPDDGTLGGTTSVPPAELAPPLRFQIEGDRNQVNVDWILGDPDKHKIVLGRVVDAAQRGLPGMQVRALGRWTPESALEQASSIMTTDEQGYFDLRIPIDMEDTYELVAKPAPGEFKPTLRAFDVNIPDPLTTENIVFIDDLKMPSYPDASTFVVPVFGFDSGGTQIPVAGAQVVLRTLLSADENTVATYTATGFTDVDGKATFELIPGGQSNRIYAADVIPPPSSEHGTLEGFLVTIGPGIVGLPSYLGGVALPRRVPVSGVIATNDGTPIANAAITATASVEFKWLLELEDQAFIDNLQPPIATTDDDGWFTLWLDPILAGAAPKYDLEIAPPAGANAPRWHVEVDMQGSDPNGLEGRNLGSIRLPPASYARGTVYSAIGEALDGAELWLFELATDSTVCLDAIRPPSEGMCEPPALLRGLWQSREDGEVRVVLPDPIGPG